MEFKQFLKESLDISKIQALYDKYNRIAFDNSLPKVPIIITNNKRLSPKTGPGTLAATLYTRNMKTHENKDIRLVFKNVTLPEDLLIQILVHEMIHVKIAFGSERDSSMHGPLFMKCLSDAESKVGFKIPVNVETKDFYKTLNNSEHFEEKEVAIFYILNHNASMYFFFFQKDKLDYMRINFNSFAYRVSILSKEKFKEIGYGTIKTRLYKQFPVRRNIPFVNNAIVDFKLHGGSLDMYHMINIKNSI